MSFQEDQLDRLPGWGHLGNGESAADFILI